MVDLICMPELKAWFVHLEVMAMNVLHKKRALSESPEVFEHYLDPLTRLRFRTVCPGDRSRFAMAFAQLSDESRYCRCFAYRNELTEKELDMLCNVDGTSHIAIVAVSLDKFGKEDDSVGGARFIRLDARTDEAELAFLVTDNWQQRHVGRLLLQHILEIAQARGIRSLRCYLLPGNQKARSLLISVSRHTGWAVSFDEEGALLNEPVQHAEVLRCAS